MAEGGGTPSRPYEEAGIDSPLGLHGYLARNDVDLCNLFARARLDGVSPYNMVDIIDVLIGYLTWERRCPRRQAGSAFSTRRHEGHYYNFSCLPNFVPSCCTARNRHNSGNTMKARADARRTPKGGHYCILSQAVIG
jgi:hypothetical protein